MNEGTFRTWLESKGYVSKTINQKVKDAETYREWLNSKGLEMIESSYRLLMDFIGDQQKHGRSQAVISVLVKSLKQYHEYLQLENPAVHIKIRKIPDPKVAMFTGSELDTIYQSYQSIKTGQNEGYYYKSDQLLLGLIIYQGLDLQDIYRLELEHLQLDKGKVYVKGSAKGNSRMLKLESFQILPLYDYRQQIRNQLLNKSSSTNYVSIKGSDKFFIPQCEKLIRLKLQWRKLGVKVREQTTTVTINSLQQLRQSRFTIWVREHGIRQAQYMAGFNYASSMERYKNEDIEGLKQQINKYHPLK